MPVTPPTPRLLTERLTLEPLRVAHASEMVAVLADPRLYEFTGGEPPTLDQLERRYALLYAGSRKRDEHWHNWIVRHRSSADAVGSVQATATASSATVAWTIGVPWQHQGFAKEAAQAMCQWLQQTSILAISAWIHPDHTHSQGVASFLGLSAGSSVNEEGELPWSRLFAPRSPSPLPVVLIEPTSSGLLHDR